MTRKISFAVISSLLVTIFAVTLSNADPIGVLGNQVPTQTGRLRMIKIGVAAPFSVQAMAPEPQHIYNGVRMAVDNFNLKGEIPNLNILLVKGDDGANRNKALSVARMFGRDPAVMGVVGHYNSSATLAGALMYNRYRLVAISPSATSPRISQAGRYIFRVVPSDAQQGRILAGQAITYLHARRAIVIYDNDDYGRGLSYFFVRTFTARGGKVLARIPYMAGVTNLGQTLTALKSQNPDLIFAACIPHSAAAVFAAADSVGLRNVTKLCGDGCIPQSFKKLAGKHAEGVYHSQFLNPNSISYKQFVRAYKNKYGYEPSPWAAFAYDAANLIIKALQERGISREAVRRYLSIVGRGLPPYQGVTGTITFDARGDAIRKIYLARVINGKSVIVK